LAKHNADTVLILRYRYTFHNTLHTQSQSATLLYRVKLAVSWLKIVGLGLKLAARILSHETATLPFLDMNYFLE